MTTNPDLSNAKQLNPRHGPYSEDAQWSQSAAIRGAAKAFTTEGNDRPTKALSSSTNGTRAAAASAGYASRQKSVSPPKASASSLSTPFRPQSAGLSQVQQLVKGYEQSATRGKPQCSETDSDASRNLRSKSTSQVAARIASRSSPLRAPLPVSGETRKECIIPDNDASNSHQEVSNLGSRSPPNAAESKSSPSGVNKIIAPRPLQPVSVARPLRTVLSSEQNHSTENDLVVASSQRHPFRDVSSTLAARAAVRNTVALGSSSVSEPLWSEGDVSITNDVPSRNSGHVRSFNGSRQTLQSEVALHDGQDDSRDETHPMTDDGDFSGNRSRRRTTSKPIPPARTRSAHSRPRFPSISKPHYIDERTGLTEVSLADAIVASSLASSRAPSPSKQAPAPPPPRRSSVSRSLFRRHHSSDTDLPRHVSPYKGMRQTLRKYDSDDDDEDENSRRKHRHFMKHPNKHREGSRQRWKDKVTERERKRYEGVWAANKGMFLTESFSIPDLEAIHETPPSELVLDLVVRDVWNRSRLPVDTLAEIWDLVDRQGVGTLTRDEFVLGLWLIDQRLKGRKLPIRVSPTLWASVRHAWGMRVPRRL